MRRLSPLAVLCASQSIACGAFFHFDDYTTAEPIDAMPGSSIVDVAVPATEAAAPTYDGGADVFEASTFLGCRTNAECNVGGDASVPSLDGASDAEAGSAEGGVVSPFVCVKTSGKCAPLLTAECPRVHGDYANDDAVLVGTLLTTSDAVGDLALENAALLAADELNSAVAGGGLPPMVPSGATRPLVVVGCDPSSDVLRAAKHLVDDLHVPAIVGPRVAEDVVNVTQQVSAKGDTLLVTPVSLVSDISALVDDDLTWRDVPSDSQRAKLVIEQMNEIESVLHATRGPTVKLGILYRGDAQGLSARDAISGKLIINGHFISDPANAGNVTLDSYENAGSTAEQTAIATKYSRALPDMIFVTAPEQVANVLVPLEQALTLARATVKPYYVVTDAVKSADFLARLATTNVGADIRRRLRGVGVRPDTNSAATFGTFESAYQGRFGTDPSPSATAATYDAMYGVAYAIAASPGAPPTGASVARGLRSLGVGDAFSVGAGQARVVMQSLAAGKSVSLRGTFSLMQWDSAGDIMGGTVEVWCVGTASGASAFGSSGLTMDVQTQVVGGAFVQCQ
jgi:ABC-type branched-subunit amino acid transport system substrate-binding protein